MLWTQQQPRNASNDAYPSSFDSREVGKAKCQRESRINMSQVHHLKEPEPTVYTHEKMCQSFLSVGTKENHRCPVQKRSHVPFLTLTRLTDENNIVHIA